MRDFFTCSASGLCCCTELSLLFESSPLSASILTGLTIPGVIGDCPGAPGRVTPLMLYTGTGT